MTDYTALRAWHGSRPGGHRPLGRTAEPLCRDDAGKLVPLTTDQAHAGARCDALLPTRAAWWCDCGEPLHGGYAPAAPLPEIVEGYRRARTVWSDDLTDEWWRAWLDLWEAIGGMYAAVIAPHGPTNDGGHEETA